MVSRNPCRSWYLKTLRDDEDRSVLGRGYWLLWRTLKESCASSWPVGLPFLSLSLSLSSLLPWTPFSAESSSDDQRR